MSSNLGHVRHMVFVNQCVEVSLVSPTDNPFRQWASLSKSGAKGRGGPTGTESVAQSQGFGGYSPQHGGTQDYIRHTFSISQVDTHIYMSGFRQAAKWKHIGRPKEVQKLLSLASNCGYKQICHQRNLDILFGQRGDRVLFIFTCYCNPPPPPTTDFQFILQMTLWRCTHMPAIREAPNPLNPGGSDISLAKANKQI